MVARTAGAPPDAAAIRAWRKTWQQAGEVLEAERWARLAGLSEAHRARMTLDLLGLWRPEVPADDGQGLVLIQQALARVAARR